MPGLVRDFKLALYTPLPEGNRTDFIDYNPEVTSLRFSTALPGGFQNLEVGYDVRYYAPDGALQRRSSLEVPVDVRLLGHVELWAGQRLVWEGRIQRLDGKGADLTGFLAVGYGLDAPKDDTFESADLTQLGGAAALVRVLTAAAPLLQLQTSGLFQDPGITHQLAEFTFQQPAQVVEQFEKAGGQANVQFDLAAWEVRRTTFLPRSAPAQPDFLIPLERQWVEWHLDGSETYGAAKMQFTDGGVTKFTNNGQWTVDPTFADRFGGLLRRKPLSGSEMPADVANQFVQTWLAQHTTGAFSARVTRPPERGLEQYNGGELPTYLVRAGQWAMLGDQGPYLITRTQYDAHSGQFECDLNQPPPGWPELVQELRRIAQKSVDGVNPITGAPLTSR